MQSSLDALGARLEEFVAHTQRQTGVPGIAVAVSNLEHRIYVNVGVRVAGWPDPLTERSQFRLGCVTKLLLAIVALELVRKGDLELNVPIGEYLNELRGTRHGQSVDISHLLSHTSGYRGTNILEARARAFTWASFVDYLRSAPQFFVPGTVFNYEHTEAVLLGRIIRRVTGRDSGTLVREMVFEPLNLLSASAGGRCAGAIDAGDHCFDQVSGGFARADQVPALPEFWRPSFAQHTLSVADLVTVAEALVAAREKDAGPVSAGTLALMEETAIALPENIVGSLRNLQPIAFGLGAARLPDGLHGNSGLSHGQCLGVRFDSESGICAAVGVNAPMPHLRDFILASICEVLTGRRAGRKPPEFEFDLAELTGVYVGGGETVVTADRNRDRLIIEIGTATSSRKLRAELVAGKDKEPVLHCATPHLSVGFFHEADGGNIGLMIGLGAFKRLSGRARSGL